MQIIIEESDPIYFKLLEKTLSFLEEKGNGISAFLKVYKDSKTSDELIKRLDCKSLNLLANLAKNKIKPLCIWDKNYPERLRQIFNPPPVLYTLGNFDTKKMNRNVSIVGTRDSSDYGEILTKKLVDGLKEFNFAIISGMAFGIDKLAHEYALSINPNTYCVAVLPGNINEPIPKSNYKLYEKVLDSGGCIVSENSIGIKITPGMFAQRNRIIAGLSDNIVVVEAGEKSGALITAQIGFENNRNIYTFPGDVTRKNYIGTHNLIKQLKAKLITSHLDIISDLELKSIKDNIAKIANLTQNQSTIITCLQKEKLNFEEIILHTKLNFSDLNLDLTFLELEGLIYRDFFGKYILC